ncbi:hypothetical protein [Trichocoleus sp. DQ-A2]
MTAYWLLNSSALSPQLSVLSPQSSALSPHQMDGRESDTFTSY